MKTNQHSRRQILFFLTFVCVASLYAFQNRWGIPFFVLKPPTDKALQVIPVEPGMPVREEAVKLPEVPRRPEIESFKFVSEESLNAWEQKVFKGKTAYSIQKEDSLTYLRSESADASSGLFIKTQHKATPDMWLEWKWRAHQFPKKKSPEKLSNRSEDDFSARIYVIFAASNIFRSDVIEYVWDEFLPVGSHSESPFSDRIHLLVVKSGQPVSGADGWDVQARNVYQDYKSLFGKEPKYDIGMIAVMSDSDNTRTSASADFADIVLSKG